MPALRLAYVGYRLLERKQLQMQAAAVNAVQRRYEHGLFVADAKAEAAADMILLEREDTFERLASHDLFFAAFAMNTDANRLSAFRDYMQIRSRMHARAADSNARHDHGRGTDR